MTIDASATPTVAHLVAGGLGTRACRLVRLLAAGFLLGAVTGLAAGLSDPAWAAFSMFLGACAGTAAAAGAGALGAVVDRSLRYARAQVRRVGVATGRGLGAAATLGALAQVWHVVPPWSALGPLAVLVLVSTSTYWRRHR